MCERDKGLENKGARPALWDFTPAGQQGLRACLASGKEVTRSQAPGSLSFEALERNNRHLLFIFAKESRGVVCFFLLSFFLF